MLVQGNNKTDYSSASDVRLSIFEGQNNGTYSLKSQTGNLTSSFLHSNSSRRIKISNKNVLSLLHQSMRHDYELKFRYEKNRKDYMLIGSEFNNYNSGNTSTNFLSGKRIITEKESTTKNIAKGLKPISAVDDFSVYELISD